MKIEIKEILDAQTVRITTSDERWYLHPKKKEWVASATWVSGYCPKGVHFYKWLASKGWDEAEAYKLSQGDKGTIVHHATEELARGVEINHDDVFPDSDGNQRELNASEYEAVISFYDWCQEYKPKFLAHEKTVFNEKTNTAGTLDHLVEIDGVVWLIDKKISANIYTSHEAQISSYFHSEDVNADKMAILQLGYNRNKKRYKFTEINDKFHLFLAAQHFWRDENEGKKPYQKDYPRKLKLKE